MGLGCTHRLHLVPFSGSYLGPYQETPKRNYYGAYGYGYGLRVSRASKIPLVRNIPLIVLGDPSIV